MDLSLILEVAFNEKEIVLVWILQKKKPQIRLNLRLLAEMVGFEPTFQNAEKSAFWRELGEILRPLERTGERDSGSQNSSTQYVASDADKIKAAKDG